MRRPLLALTLMTISTLSLAARPPGTENETNPEGLPWMTGPLMAPAGSTVPTGKLDWEPYLFATDSYGVYNNRGKVISNAANVTVQPLLTVDRGITDWMDIQVIFPYSFNSHEGQSYNGFADQIVLIGLQALKAKPALWWYPDLRVTLEETFPGGKYQQLNPARLGTDATGIGSYQSSIGLNFQKTWHLGGVHYLSSRLSYTYTIPSSVHVLGYNAFGGGDGTNGTVNVGIKQVLDGSLEYSLTKHWVLASDIIYNNAGTSTFRGNPGLTSSGLPASVGQPSNHQYSLAPAIEYNWNSHYGVIGGAWFTFAGTDASDFVSGVVAFNYYN